MVLAEAAVLLGDGEREEAVLAEQLEVAPREEQLVVRALRVARISFSQSSMSVARSSFWRSVKTQSGSHS